MAHTCPRCGQYCTCNGDWDDCDMGEWGGCTKDHDGCMDDEFGDDDLEDDWDDDEAPYAKPLKKDTNDK